MDFQRTTTSLFQTAQEMQITREKEIAQLLIAYETQLESSAFPDRSLLFQAREMTEQKKNTGLLDHELVELAHQVYRSLGAWSEEIELLRRYREQCTPLDPTTYAWVWWHIVDCLALLEENLQVTHEQEALLSWATAVFPLNECFFVLNDGTQANCWVRVQQAERWFMLLDRLFEQARSTHENLLDRFYCLRTASHVCFRCADEARLCRYLTDLASLKQEVKGYDELSWISIEIAILHAIAAQKRGSVPGMRTQVQEATDLLWQWEPMLTTTKQHERFRSLCHNLAAPLYRARQYDLAIPLFRKTIAYHTNPHYAYLWLAASIWQTTHERDEVISLLQQAAARYDGTGQPWEHFRTLPEFQSVQEDAEFSLIGV